MSTAPTLSAFESWLARRGRSPSTIQVYLRRMRPWLDNPERAERLLVDSRKSPNYRRNLAAALRTWAKFAGDDDLAERLEELKLPPAGARDSREPLEREQWFAVIAAVEAFGDASQPKGAALRGACGLMAKRGLRCADALRIEKKEIQDALRTGLLVYDAKGAHRLHATVRPRLERELELLAGLPWRGKREVWEHVSPTLDSATRRVRRCLDQIAVQCGLEPHELFSHRFRHTYATRFLQEMVGDPEAVFKLKDQMGWTRLETATNYLRRSRQEELDDVDSRLFSPVKDD